MIVGAASLSTLFVVSFAAALWAPWAVFAAVVDATVGHRLNMDVTQWPAPLLGMSCTAGVLWLAARSRVASVIAVLWFIFNVLVLFEIAAAFARSGGHE